MTTTDLVIRIIKLENRVVVPTAIIQDVLLRASRILAGLPPSQSFDTVGELVHDGQRENDRLGNPMDTYVSHEPIPLGQTEQEQNLASFTERYKNGE